MTGFQHSARYAVQKLSLKRGIAERTCKQDNRGLIEITVPVDQHSCNSIDKSD